MKKKFLSFMLAICLIIPCAFALVACSKNDDTTAKIMNVSLNPEIEFILDKNDKVLSVNALNEDGNHIILVSIDETTEVSEFEGITADEAVELFLKITEENGYLVTGDEEEIKIEISGNADNLMRKVKEKANKFFNDNGLDINITTDKIKKADILKEVKECMKEYTDVELESMTQEQLINLLKGSRQETKNLLTQELKDAYYNMRVEKINIAELESLATTINNLSNIPGIDTILENIEIPNIDNLSILLTTFSENIEVLKTKIEALESAYNEYFLSETSAYNIAKDEYINAKKELLDARLEYGVDGISESEQLELDDLEVVVENAKETLESAKDAADLAIATIKQEVENIFNTIKSDIENIKVILSNIPGVDLSAINNAKQKAKDNFKTQFENHDHFGGHIGRDKGHWGKTAA